jgi:hypothetical protein
MLETAGTIFLSLLSILLAVQIYGVVRLFIFFQSK